MLLDEQGRTRGDPVLKSSLFAFHMEYSSTFAEC